MTETENKKSTKGLWSIQLSTEEEKKLLAKAFASLCGIDLKEGWEEAKKMPELTTMVNRAMGTLDKRKLFENFGTETIVKTIGRGKSKRNETEIRKKELTIDDVFMIPAFRDVYENLKEKEFYGLLFYKPTDKVPNMLEVKNAKFLPTKITNNGVTTTEKAEVVANTILEKTQYERHTNGVKNNKPKTVTLDQATINAINKKEPSIDEQIKNTVTKIAKSKDLMNLSNEQLKDYLKEAYKISDENALNNMMNAVVAKRAELLANKQLKQEELTEIDISKLQEQSQRDFEKKLQDQNLRYILPAQLEKRERLVQNRLNPELLKSGY